MAPRVCGPRPSFVWVRSAPGGRCRAARISASFGPVNAESRAVAVQVLRLAGPAIATSLLGTLVFLADRVMLARHGQDSLASMQVQGPLMWSIASVFMGLCVGTVALVARATGAGDRGRVRATARAALRLALLLGVLVAIGGLCLLDVIVDGLGPDAAHLRDLSRGYLRIGIAMLPAEFVATTAAMILHGHGDTRTPLLVGIVGNVVNVLVNAACIFGVRIGPLTIPELGVQGAAIGTAIAFVLQAVLLVAWLARHDHPASVRRLFRRAPLAGVRDDAEALARLVRLGAPGILERLVVHAGFLAFVKVMTSLGELEIAANQALITIESICFLGADGFGVAAATVMGQRLGADDPIAARRGGLIATGLAVSTISAIGMGLWLCGPVLLPIFGDAERGPALVAEGLRTMPLLALAAPFMTAAIVVAQALRGAGDTRSPVLAALVGCLVVRVGLASWLALELELGLPGAWWASTADWIVRTLLLGAVFLRGRWARLQI